MKDKEPVEEEASEETLENVKKKISKLQATIDLQDPIKNEASSTVKKNHSSDLILSNLDKQMVKKKRYANIKGGKNRVCVNPIWFWVVRVGQTLI